MSAKRKHLKTLVEMLDNTQRVLSDRTGRPDNGKALHVFKSQ
jgi:hypothetical protein